MTKTRCGGWIMAVAATVAATACGQPRAVMPLQPDPGDATFDIEVIYWPGTNPTGAQRGRIQRAVESWEGVITGPLPDAQVTGDIGCGPASPDLDAVVDDLVIYIRLLDLVALAESGPCLVREDGLPIIGTIWLDSRRSLTQLVGEFLESLVKHEIAHVLGFGTLWEERGLLDTFGGDVHFTGAAARFEFDQLGGAGYAGAKVPVEIGGGEGSARRHWRTAVFGESELMTPTVGRELDVRSRITIASFADLGYEVDLETADPFLIPATSRVPSVSAGR